MSCAVVIQRSNGWLRIGCAGDQTNPGVTTQQRNKIYIEGKLVLNMLFRYILECLV